MPNHNIKINFKKIIRLFLPQIPYYQKTNLSVGDEMKKTEVPNVLFDLGISPMAVGVYVYLKKISAGEGFCCEKQPSICRELNIAPATYIKYRKELARGFHALKGKPLIYVTERKKRSGVNDTTKITFSIFEDEKLE